MESFQSSVFDEESKRGEKEKYNPFHSLKFRSIPTKFLLSRLSFPRLGGKIYHYTTHRRSGNTLPQIGEVLRSDEGGKRNDISK